MYIPGGTHISNHSWFELFRIRPESEHSYYVVHVRNKTVAKTLRRYANATSDDPEAMQTCDEYLPSGTITMIHGLHQEDQHNYALVTDAPSVEKEVYAHELARQQEIISYTVKAKNSTQFDFMCLTMIDPATSWFEIAELQHSDIQYTREGKNKSSD